MSQTVVTTNTEKSARELGAVSLREPEGDTLITTDSIEVELNGGVVYGPEVGGPQASDSLELDAQVHTPKATHGLKKVAVSVDFTAPGATQVIVLVGYINAYGGGLTPLFTEEKTATAKDSTLAGRFYADPLDFETRGATLFEIRRKAPSAGDTNVRAWAY